MKFLTLCRVRNFHAIFGRKWLHYVQGQIPQPKVREYFYFIDHQGMLFLDDSKMKNFTSCFKEKKFLLFFFSRLTVNKTGRYQDDFPYISFCGRERNYIRCDDVPIVFTGCKKSQDSDEWFLYYNHAGEDLKYLFNPQEICMLPATGRVYHPTFERAGGVGLIKSSFAIEISQFFEYEGSEEHLPSHFLWEQKRYKLTNNLVKALSKRNTKS